MPASCMSLVTQPKKFWTRILHGIAYFIQPIKSHSAPGRLKNVWGHSILLIKVSQRHSLKHLHIYVNYVNFNLVIVDGGKKAVSTKKRKHFQSKKNSTIRQYNQT